MPAKFTLIDDDEDDLEFLRSALSDTAGDSQISTFTDALIARDLLEEIEANNLPDVIIVDHQMPKMLGTELIQWIRSRGNLEPCSVVMYSTDTSHVTPEVEQALNFTAIAKVNSYDQLMEVARQLVMMARSGRKPRVSR
jgi:CheY-like chemotaxis protein